MTKLGFEFRDPHCGAHSLNTHFISGKTAEKEKISMFCLQAVTYYLPKIYTASDIIL